MRLLARSTAVLAVAMSVGPSSAAPSGPTVASPVVSSPDKPQAFSCDPSKTVTFAVEKTPPSAAPTVTLKPFSTFSDALRAAQAKGACHVILEAGPGQYNESIDITIPHVKINSRTTPNAVLRGSITNKSGHWLELQTITIEHAPGTAIRQTGGRLSMLAVRIIDTDAVPGQVDSGIGLRVSGGAQVGVRLSVFERNAQAIRAEGDATRLWITGSVVTGGGANPDVRARMIAARGTGEFDVGAILVHQGATAWASSLTVQQAEINAIQVTRNARMRLEGTTIRTTSTTPAPVKVGGIGLSVRDGATVEWFRTSVSDSGGCGIATQGAYLTTNGGLISKAPVGACVIDPARQSPNCLQRGAEYREVGVPLQAPTYTPPAGLAPGAEPPCAHVAAEAAPAWL